MDNLEIYANLFRQGMSLREIERRFGVSRRALAQELRIAGYEIKKPVDEALVVSRYDEGQPMSVVAEAMGISIKRVKDILVANGSGPSIRKTDEEILAEIAADHDYGFVTRISKSLGVSRARVSKLAVGAGVPIQLEKYPVSNKLFSSVESEDTAYWLGFMYADGYVLSGSKDFGITLSSSDRGHLEKFAGFLGVPVDIVKDYSSVTPYGESKYSRVIVRSEDVVHNLILLGCVPKKTHILEPPEGVPANLTRHFVRGIVDGDGYIAKSKYKSVEICGTYAVLDWIRQNTPGDWWHQPQQHKSIYRLRTGGDAQAREVIKWLYADCGTALERKLSIAQEYTNNVK